jgi:hypothetical protein
MEIINLDGKKEYQDLKDITASLYNLEEIVTSNPCNETLFFMADLLGDIEEYNLSDNFNRIINKNDSKKNEIISLFSTLIKCLKAEQYALESFCMQTFTPND